MSVNNKKSTKCSILKQKSLLSVAMVFSLIFTSTELLTVQLTVKAQPLFTFSHVSRSQVLGDAGFVYPDWPWSYSIHSLKKNPWYLPVNTHVYTRDYPALRDYFHRYQFQIWKMHLLSYGFGEKQRGSYVQPF